MIKCAPPQPKQVELTAQGAPIKLRLTVGYAEVDLDEDGVRWLLAVCQRWLWEMGLEKERMAP